MILISLYQFLFCKMGKAVFFNLRRVFWKYITNVYKALWYYSNEYHGKIHKGMKNFMFTIEFKYCAAGKAWHIYKLWRGSYWTQACLMSTDHHGHWMKQEWLPYQHVKVNDKMGCDYVTKQVMTIMRCIHKKHGAFLQVFLLSNLF